MRVEKCEVSFDAENGKTVTVVGSANLIAGSRGLNSAYRAGSEKEFADLTMTGSGLSVGDVVRYGSEYYQVVDVSAGMSGIKKYFFKIISF